MKKTIVIILILLVILSVSGIAYLNKVVLPQKVKGLIIKAIKNQTQKRVTLGSIRINIFKGLVLKDLGIYDNDAAIIKVKEASCVFWVWGLVQKKIIIPSINFNSAEIFLEKRKDNSFNLWDLFPSEQKASSQVPAVQASSATNGVKPSTGFILEIYKISITNSTVNFKDNSFNPLFNQDLDDVNVNIYLSLPASLKFKASARIPGNLKPNITLSGEFKIVQEELNANIVVNNLSLDKFSPYYQSLGIGIKKGLIDATVSLGLKGGVMNFDCQVKSSGLNLIKDKTSFDLNAQINATIKYSLKDEKVQYFGRAVFTDSTISGLDLVESVNGLNATVNFDNNGLVSDNIQFDIRGMPVRAKLKLDDFSSPAVGFELAFKDLVVESNFTVDKTKVDISTFSGKYLNSDFNLTGKLDSSSFDADISGVLNIKLQDLKKPLVKFKEAMDRISPEGDLQIKFTLSGDIKDIKGCSIQAKISSPQISLYGLKGSGFYSDYNQQSGIIDIPTFNFSFYGGTVNASAKANLKSDNLPYSLNLSMQGVMIEELKLNTGAKDKDIAGIMQGEVKVDGYYNDLSKLTGSGSLAITQGKLWEINIFKGLGKMLFNKDLTQMVFYEGSCNFSIQDSYIFTKDLMLKGNMAYLSGLVKLGFNGSIDVSLNVDILDNLVPLNGTLKDVTTAVIGKAGRFATINMTGTLSDPKYKLKPVMENVIQGLVNILNKKVFKQ